MELELYTERLILRPYDLADADLDVEMATDPEVMEYFGGAVSEEEAMAESPNFTRRCAGGRIGVWTVVDRLGQEKLGQAFLAPLPVEAEDTQWEEIRGDELPDGDIELGFLFKRSAWGRGLATEACRRLLRFAFEETPLTEIAAVIEVGNAASEKVLSKCGFVPEGTRRAYAEQRPAFRLTRDRFMARFGGAKS